MDAQPTLNERMAFYLRRHNTFYFRTFDKRKRFNVTVTPEYALTMKKQLVYGQLYDLTGQ